MTDMTIKYGYFRLTDNTIGEAEFQTFEPTSGTYGVQVAKTYAESFGFELLSYGPAKWTNEDWEAGYAALERDGYFTAERQEELFDTPIAGTLDRIDVDAVQSDGYWH